MIPVLLGVTLLVFFIMHLAPGNVAGMILGENATPEQIAALEHEMGLDRPLLVQYFDYLVGLLHGDLGTSYTTGSSVTGEIMARFPYTVQLTLVAAVVSILLALPLGILAAVKQNTWVDNVSMVVSLIGVSMPIFWLAVMLILLFSLKLGWFPVYGADSWKSIVLPAISLGFMNMASIARTTRSSMLDVLSQDYIRTSRSRGIPARVISARLAPLPPSSSRMLALPSEKRYTYLLAISFIPFCCLTRRRRPCHGLSPSHLEQPGSRGPRPTPMVRRSCSAGISHSPLYLFEGNIATSSWVFFTVFLPARVKNILFRRTL